MKIAEAKETSNLSFFDRMGVLSHGVDCDWRFTQASVEKFGSILASHTRVLCAGTPNLYDYLARKGCNTFLIDKNSLLSPHLIETDTAKFMVGDISAIEGLNKDFSAAVMDPPWYPEDYENWLVNILKVLQPGAYLYIVLFKSLTRPSAFAERELLIQKLSDIGQAKFLELNLEYATPLFETEVLKRHDIYGLNTWRTADVLEVKLSSKSIEWPKKFNEMPISKIEWQKYPINNQIIAIARNDQDFGALASHSIDAVSESYELLSVSRRDPNWKGANVWTSRSRAARVIGTQTLCDILTGIAANGKSYLTGIAPINREPFLELMTNLEIDLGKL